MNIMRNRYYSQSNVPNWLKWSFWIICLIFILGAIYSVFLYKTIQKNKLAGFAEAEEQVLRETELTVIDDIHRFHGEDTFHILFGTTKKVRKEITIPKPQVNDKTFTLKDESEIIQKETILNKWHNQCQGCELKKIRSAMIDGKPLWEVTHVDKSRRYTCDYLS